ncbi:MAG: hypothetical protein IPP45_11675 [Sphingomonadales bacterium]|nr:hypothetical protein [Sphingomonadales bacterium]
MRDRFGINVDALEIILEPDNGDGWSPTAVGRAIVAAKSRLAAAGINQRSSPLPLQAQEAQPVFWTVSRQSRVRVLL